jgi:hypothetical protein
MFWIPAHTMFELALIGVLVIAWSLSEVRFWLLVALISHVVMRFWSLVDFVPKALAFERADPVTITIIESTARRWTRRSLWRLPLDIVTCASMLAALIATVPAAKYRRRKSRTVPAFTLGTCQSPPSTMAWASTRTATRDKP